MHLKMAWITDNDREINALNLIINNYNRIPFRRYRLWLHDLIGGK